MRLSGVKVLLIEDADDIRNAYDFLMRMEGAEVVAVATGREGLASASRDRFDVVLSDLGLPDVPGEAVIRQIRAMASPPPRIVVVTGYGEPHVGRARVAGARTVLVKPVEWADLLAAQAPEPVPAGARLEHAGQPAAA